MRRQSEFTALAIFASWRDPVFHAGSCKMSWWISRKDKHGQRSLWLVDMELMVLLPLLLILTSVLAAQGLLSVTLLLAGFVCLLIAKLSVMRRGVRVSWGPRLMTRGYAWLYKIGYLLMFAGVALRLALQV